MFIQDPRSGIGGNVSKEGMLEVIGVMQTSEAHHAAEHGATFLTGNGMITMDGTDNYVWYMKNNSQTELLYIYALFASTMVDGVYISFVKNPVYSSGGTLGSSVNTNFTKKTIAPNIVYVGNDMVMSSDGDGPIMGGFIQKGFTPVELDGTIVLGYLDSCALKVNGPNGSFSSVGARFWFHGNIF